MSDDRPHDLGTLKLALRAMLPELRQRWPIARLAVFGSWSRGEQRPESDVDLLVELDANIDLFAFLELEAEIARRLGRPVELVTEAALKPLIRTGVMAELEAI